MSYKIINLTLPVVVKEIENVLEDYSEYPYQVTFSVEEFRQKLIAHVLSKIPNLYTVIDDSQELQKKDDFLHRPIRERLHIEKLIHEGILDILQENAETIGFMITQKDISLN